MVKQIKKSPENTGFFSSAGNWVRLLNWSAATYQPDPTLWVRIGSPTAQLVVDDGNNVLSLRGSSHNDLYATVDQNFEDFIFEAKVNMTADLNNTCTPEVGFHYTDLNNRYFTMMRGETQNDLFIRRIEGGASYVNNSSPYNYTAGVYSNYRMTVNGNAIKLYLNEVLVTDYTDNGNILDGGFSLANFAGTPVYYDDVRVREYAEIEPVANIGTGQFLPGHWAGTVSSDWGNPLNWIDGLPGNCSLVTITSESANQPHITAPAECFNLTINDASTLIINAGGALTVNGNIDNSGELTIGSTLTSSGSLIVNGTSTGDINYNRQLQPGAVAEGNWHLVSAPVQGK
jgi:hypothetical protein